MEFLKSTLVGLVIIGSIVGLWVISPSIILILGLAVCTLLFSAGLGTMIREIISLGKDG